MLGISTDNHYFTFALDNLAFVAHGFNRRAYLHNNYLLYGTTCLGKCCLQRCFFTAPCYSALGEVIGGHLNSDLITKKYSDVIESELAGNVSGDLKTVGKFNNELGVG